MAKFLIAIFILSCQIGMAEDDTIQTIIKYELEQKMPNGEWKVFPTVTDKSGESHAEKLNQVVESKKDGAAMCLTAAKEWAKMMEPILKKDGYRVYVTYKQRDYKFRSTNGEKRIERTVAVEIFEDNILKDPEPIDNLTTVSVNDDDSHKTMAGCKRKIEAAYKTASNKLKNGKAKPAELMRVVLRAKRRSA